MRISDWSSDVCSSDLPDDDQVIALVGAVDIDAAIACREGAVLGGIGGELVQQQGEAGHRAAGNLRIAAAQCDARRRVGGQLGRASWRERVCQYGEILVVAVTLKKKDKIKDDM